MSQRKPHAKPDRLVYGRGPQGEIFETSTVEVAFIEMLRALAAKIAKAGRALSPADRGCYLDEALDEVHDNYSAVDVECADVMVKSLRARIEDSWRH